MLYSYHERSQAYILNLPKCPPAGASPLFPVPAFTMFVLCRVSGSALSQWSPALRPNIEQKKSTLYDQTTENGRKRDQGGTHLQHDGGCDDAARPRATRLWRSSEKRTLPRHSTTASGQPLRGGNVNASADRRNTNKNVPQSKNACLYCLRPIGTRGVLVHLPKKTADETTEIVQ